MSSSTMQLMGKIGALGTLLILVAGCGHEQVRRLPEQGTAVASPRSGSIPRNRPPGEQAAVHALRQLGVPYRYGGQTTSGFDCSGLVQYAWSQAGLKIPRTTAEQWRQLSPVGEKELRAGDLLFFRIDGRISHVGMYLGEARFVHAPSSGREVSVASLDSGFYRKTFVRAARP